MSRQSHHPWSIHPLSIKSFNRLTTVVGTTLINKPVNQIRWISRALRVVQLSSNTSRWKVKWHSSYCQCNAMNCVESGPIACGCGSRKYSTRCHGYRATTLTHKNRNIKTLDSLYDILKLYWTYLWTVTDCWVSFVGNRGSDGWVCDDILFHILWTPPLMKILAVPVAKHYAMKVYGWRDSKVPLTLTFRTKLMWVMSFIFRLLRFLGKVLLYPTGRRLWGA
jgi:hypothetical protein